MRNHPPPPLLLVLFCTAIIITTTTVTATPLSCPWIPEASPSTAQITIQTPGQPLVLSFQAGQDLSQLAWQVVNEFGLQEGGGCHDAACVHGLLLDSLEHEALHTPALNDTQFVGDYSTWLTSCHLGPQCFPYLSDVVALLDQASHTLACPAAPSAFLLEYLSQGTAGDTTTTTYPRLCGLGEYGACACVMADVVMAHLLQSCGGRIDDATLLSAVKDLAMAVTFQSGALREDLPVHLVEKDLLSIASQLFEIVLQYFPKDPVTRRYCKIDRQLVVRHILQLAGTNRLLLRQPDLASHHFMALLPYTHPHTHWDPHQPPIPPPPPSPPLHSFFRITGHRVPPHDPSGLDNEGFIHVNHLKLQHDALQLDFLVEQARLPPYPYQQLAQQYHNLSSLLPQYQSMAYNAALHQHLPSGQLVHAVRVPAHDFPGVTSTYGRLLYHEPPPAMPEGALSSTWSMSSKEVIPGGPTVVVIDGALKGQTLSQLLAMAQESTVWNEARSNGYLGAYHDHTGFASGLLLQVGLELQERLPHLLKPYKLNMVWGYKYDQDQAGISLHCDDAAMTMNCYLTEDSANLKEGTGGMVMYGVTPPWEWNYSQYTDAKKMETLLRAPENHYAATHPLVVPFRQNRCVVFNSSLTHSSDPALHFKPGYRNRRINLTFLYGMKHHPMSS